MRPIFALVSNYLSQSISKSIHPIIHGIKPAGLSLQRLTGGVCVLKEPTRVVIYRGWEPGADPPWIKRDPETGAVPLSQRPPIPRVLGRVEEANQDALDGLAKSSESESGEDGKAKRTSVYEDRDDRRLGGKERAGARKGKRRRRLVGEVDKDDVVPVLQKGYDHESGEGRKGAANGESALARVVPVSTIARTWRKLMSKLHGSSA